MSENNTTQDCVNPEMVPQRMLPSGSKMPGIGLGTFGSDRFSAEQVGQAIYEAAQAGYRHFDCASVYGNEKEVGQSFKKIISSGIERDDLWITSKLWNDKHTEEDVIPACQSSLDDLGLNYLNLYLTHWPFPNFHSAGCDVESRSADAKPYIHENFMKTWRQMEKLVELGMVKHIGTSNMTIPKLELLLRDAKIKPVVNEMECHPHFQQQDLFEFLVSNDIAPIGFCPIGSPTRPDRDRVETDTVDIEDPVIKEIAERLKVHPAVICVKWAVQRGQTPIPFSIHKVEFLSNIQSTISAPLSDEDMTAISKIDKNNRLIKGQVFLWKEKQSWEDLWDLNGQIEQ